MKRILSTMKRQSSSQERSGSNSGLPQGDSPEAIVVREVTAFCESGGPNNQNAGEEYLHLPAIVDAAESSPSAAKEAAVCIRKIISKDNSQRAYAQYNAVMLTRILTDNPAQNFTKNFDGKFVTTVRDLLRDGRDMSVQQILRETLDYFETQKLAENETLGPLVEMWKKEKTRAPATGKYSNTVTGGRVLNAPPYNYQQQQQQQQSYFARQHRAPRGLPPPDELAARIEEAKTTARLLLQTIQSTPTSELLGNDLIKEFADRAASANRSIQGYINCDNPHPDEDTMLTLIETNEQLSIAMSKHQRAVLQARKALGVATPSPQPQTQVQPGQNIYSTPPRNDEENFVPPPGPPPSALGAIRQQDYAYPTNPPPVPSRARPVSPQNVDYGITENPFSDEAAPLKQPAPKSYSLFDRPSRTSPGPQQGNPLQQPSAYSQEVRPPNQYTSYNQGYQATPSYINRQESATNNLTMHGASPTSPEPDAGERRPVSLVDNEPTGIQRETGNLRM